MAKVEYREGQEPLSGIYCGIMYKTSVNGKHSAFVLPLPTAQEARKNPAARADRIVKLCVVEIQKRMHNPQEAIKQYTNITHRVRRLYGRVFELEKKEDKLIKMLIDAYFQTRRVLPSRKAKSGRLEFEEADNEPT